jgi:hypothetical protein
MLKSKQSSTTTPEMLATYTQIHNSHQGPTLPLLQINVVLLSPDVELYSPRPVRPINLSKRDGCFSYGISVPLVQM